MRKLCTALIVASTVAFANLATAQIVRSGAGLGTTAARDAFRADLGGGTTAAANGLFSDVTGERREINWDGVPDGFAAPNNLTATFFNVNSPRGVVFSTPGTGFQVSANAGALAPIEFGNIDGSYSQTFSAFSSQRLFTALGSNIIDVSFFLPGTATPGLVRGFGSIFSDVDLANITSIQLFGATNASLGTFFVPNVAGAGESLSFLGISFATPVVSRVRITSGNAALAAGVVDQNGASIDLVTLDDFLYSNPIAAIAAVPEPATWAMMLLGFGLIGGAMRKTRQRQAGFRSAQDTGTIARLDRCEPAHGEG